MNTKLKITVPPIKCQGIKTKLIPFILDSIDWKGNGKWIEPFLGSGVVLFNVKPRKALVSDTNEHIIRFYRDLQDGRINGLVVREYLEHMGKKLSSDGEEFYYATRDEFNKSGSSLDLLFLSRSCFNGMMRFSSKGKYNVPFGHKPGRFTKAYITKIVNQVEKVRAIMYERDWEFICSDWKDTLAKADHNDFVYVDPPYIGRHTDYFNKWRDEDSFELATHLNNLHCGFALSMWLENRYRKNEYIQKYFSDAEIKTFNHYYHVGASENQRHEMIEALVIKKGFSRNTKIDNPNQKQLL